MPIRIPDALPATAALENENIFVMTEHRAMHQDIRPLRLLLLNLMPTKITTETQILRKLSNTPLQVEVELLQTASHDSKNTAAEHLEAFYTTFDAVRDEHFDGLIITGAPVEQMPYENVDYWKEVCRIMEWTKTHVTSTLHLCWGAQAGLYYHYGIPKHDLEKKKFGIFRHHVMNRKIPLVRGFDDYFYAPHSRHTEVRREDIEKIPELTILAESDEAGVFLVTDPEGKKIFVMGHPEYDRLTLDAEYKRDKEKGLPIDLPVNYYPDDDCTKRPYLLWRSHGNILYANWLNYYVYQQTPYDFINTAEIIGK